MNIKSKESEIRIFFHVVFSSLSGFVPCRSFPENGNQYDNNKPYNKWITADDNLIIKANNFSNIANNNKFGFYVVPGTVANIGEAKNHHIQEMQSILVDIDTGNTEQKLQELTKHIAKPTLIVESGGITEDGHKKLHVYWQLMTKATGEKLAQIADLRHKLALSIDGDMHFKSLHQPIRVAGSIYHKNGANKLVNIRSYSMEEYELESLVNSANKMLQAKDSVMNSQKISSNSNKKSIKEILTTKVYEGGASENTRFNRIGQVIGYWIRRYSDGLITKEQAISEIYAYNQANVVPPWGEEKLNSSISSIWRNHLEKYGKPNSKSSNIKQANIGSSKIVHNIPKAKSSTQTITTNKPFKQYITKQETSEYITKQETSEYIDKLDLTDNKNYDIYTKMTDIISNPEIVINRLDISKPTYNRTDIKNAIFKTLGIDIKDNKSGLEKSNLSKTEFNKLYKIVISSPKIVAINLYDLKQKMIFTRKDRLELEQRFIKNATSLAKLCNHNLNITAQDLQIIDIKTGITLSKEQQNAIIQLGNSPGLSVLKGHPGSGKTTVLQDFVRIVREMGCKVIATAPTNKGAMELENSIRTKVINTAKLRKEWQLEKGYEFVLKMAFDYYKEKTYKSKVPTLDDKTIIIIDEASMIDMREMDYFLSNALKARSMVILVGDTNQHKAIEVGGSLSLVEKITKVIELKEIHRHNNPDPKIRKSHRLATEKLSEFKLKEAFDIYQNLGALHIDETETKAKQAIIHEYVNQVIDKAALSGDIAGLRSVAIGCYTNENVNYFNENIRNHLKNCGILKGREHLFKSGSGSEQKMIKIALGEQIVFASNKIETENSGRVSNREIAIVSKILESNQKGIGRFQVIIRRNGVDKTVDIKTGVEDYPVSFNYGYALTSHVFEGAKIEKMLMYFEQHYESLMVLATRHVNSLKIYASENKLEDVIYRKKDLDTVKARENYQITSYAKNSNLHEGETRESYSVAKIALMLESSKRADLTTALSQNYGYQPSKKEQQYLDDLKGELKILAKEMQKSQNNLNKWKNIYSEQIIKAIENEFSLKSIKEVIIRTTNIIRSNKLLISKVLKEQPNLKQSDLQNMSSAIDNYMQQLKGNGDNSEKLEWSKLSKFHQDVVIYSYLNDNAKTRLNNLVNTHNLCQKRIIAKSNSAVRHKIYLQTLAAKNTKFSGNHLVVSNYLKGIADLATATEQLSLWQQKYLSLAEQEKIKAFLTKKLNINTKNLNNLQINPYTLLYAPGDFQKDHVRQYKEELKNLKEQQAKLSSHPNKTQLPEYQANQKRLEQIFLNNKNHLDNEIKNYLNSLVRDNKQNNHKKMVDWKDIKHRDQHLIVRKLLPNTAISELSAIIDNRQKIKNENINNAKLICENYKGFVNPESKQQLQEKQSQLEQSFTSISQKWQRTMAIKFNSKANQDLRNLTDKDLKQAMDIYDKIKKWQKDNPHQKSLSNMPVSIFGADKVTIAKYQRILMNKSNSKDPLNSSKNIMNRQFCPITKNAIKSYQEFNRNKHSLQHEIKELTKKIANEKIGITNDPLKLTMQEVLASQNLNYETVLSSADKVDYKFYFKDISVKSSFICSKKITSEVIDLLETLSDHKNKSKAKMTGQDLINSRSKVNAVMESLDSHTAVLSTNREEIKSFKTKYNKDMATIKDLEQYRTKEFPEFLSRIFKEDSHKIIARFNNQVTGYSKKQLEEHICSNNFLENLGQLKSGRSPRSLLEKIFTKIDPRENIKQNVNHARIYFTKYFDSKADIAKIKDYWQDKNYQQEIKQRNELLRQSKQLLPNKQERQLLDQLLEISKSQKAENNDQDNIVKYQQLLESNSTTKILNDYANIKSKLSEQTMVKKNNEFNLVSDTTNIGAMNNIKDLTDKAEKKHPESYRFQENKTSNNSFHSLNTIITPKLNIDNKSNELQTSADPQLQQQNDLGRGER